MGDQVKAKILKKAVIVAGHPRSGTSLACQLVESAGVKFPSDYEGDEYNQAGYYELEASKKLSQSLIEKAMTVKNTIKLNKIVDRLNQSQKSTNYPAGLKLVRIPALFFYRHITKDLKAVFIYRNPADVKASLLRRGISSFEPTWFDNNNSLIAAYENIENSIILSYETLLQAPAKIKKAFSGLDLDIDLNIIEQGQRTQKHSSIVLTDEEKRLYNRLQELEEQTF